jgi:hypothetical protein
MKKAPGSPSAQQTDLARGPLKLFPNRYASLRPLPLTRGPHRSDPVIFFLWPEITPEPAVSFPSSIRNNPLPVSSPSPAYKFPTPPLLFPLLSPADRAARPSTFLAGVRSCRRRDSSISAQPRSEATH